MCTYVFIDHCHINVLLACYMFAVGLYCKIILTVKFSQSTVFARCFQMLIFSLQINKSSLINCYFPQVLTVEEKYQIDQAKEIIFHQSPVIYLLRTCSMAYILTAPFLKNTWS